MKLMITAAKYGLLFMADDVTESDDDDAMRRLSVGGMDYSWPPASRSRAAT